MHLPTYTNTNTYIHTYERTYIHTYIHTNANTYRPMRKANCIRIDFKPGAITPK